MYGKHRFANYHNKMSENVCNYVRKVNSLKYEPVSINIVF